MVLSSLSIGANLSTVVNIYHLSSNRTLRDACFLLRTKLAASQIHGIGLFAAEFIPAGKEIWCFEPGFDLEKTVEEVLEMPLHIQEWIKHFGYLDFHLNRHIIPADDARFINHSDCPNIRQDYSRHIYGIDVALKDIVVGEEITTDYRTIEKVNWLAS